MNEDQIREALRKLRVEDVLLQTAATLIDLAARRLGLAEEDGPRQLDQAKLAIDAIRALLPLVEPHVPAELARDLGQMVANLQLAYASAAATPQQPQPQPQPQPEERPEQEGE